MHFQWIVVTSAFVSLVALLAGLFLLMRRGWLAGWLRGTGGLLALASALLLGLLAINLGNYRLLDEEKSVATISFDKTADQLYKATLVLQGSHRERLFEMTGDLWRLDARIIRWNGPLASPGGLPLYKLDRLQGRYYSLEDEQRHTRNLYLISNPDVGFKLWPAFRMLSRHSPWFETGYGSAAWLPMADGALFSLRLTASGIIARPENEPAQVAIQDWQ